MTGYDRIDRYRRRLRRQAAVRLWAERCAYALMTAAAIVLLWIYGF